MVILFRFCKEIKFLKPHVLRNPKFKMRMNTNRKISIGSLVSISVVDISVFLSVKPILIETTQKL